MNGGEKCEVCEGTGTHVLKSFTDVYEAKINGTLTIGGCDLCKKLNWGTEDQYYAGCSICGYNSYSHIPEMVYRRSCGCIVFASGRWEAGTPEPNFNWNHRCEKCNRNRWSKL